MSKEWKRKLNLLMGDMPLPNGAIDAHYEEYWHKRQESDKLLKKRSERIKKRMGAIADQIEDGARVLDIGCGNGDLLSFISQTKNRCQMTGIDISSDAVKRTQEKGFEAKQIDICGVNLEEVGTYDYIILSELIEHLANPEKLLLGLKKQVKKKIIITTPNVAFILFRMRLFFFGKFPVTTVFHIREHLSLWSVKDFTYWANALGFTVEKIIPFGGVKFCKLNQLMPNLFANHMLYILTKKEK